MRFHIHNRFSLRENRFFASELDELGVDYELIPEGIEMSYRSRWEQLSKWVQLLRVSRVKSKRSLAADPLPDVVTFNTPFEALVFARLSAREERRPTAVLTTFIVAQAGSAFTNWARRTYYRIVLRSVRIAVCHTREELATYQAMFPEMAERLIYLPYGYVRDDHGEARQEPYALPESPFLFSGGRSGRDYGTLLAAVHDLDIPVYIACDSHQFLPDEAHSSNVHVLRDCAIEAFKDMTAAARVVVVPLAPASHSAGQMVVLGAFAAGVPVITSETPAILDYVDDGRAARLVPPADVDRLRSAIVELWSDEQARGQLGRAGQAYFDATLTRRAFWRGLVQHCVRVRGGHS